MATLTANSAAARAVADANGRVTILRADSTTSAASKADEIAMVLGWTVEQACPTSVDLLKDGRPAWAREFERRSAEGRPVLFVVRDGGDPEDLPAVGRFVTAVCAHADSNADWGVIVVTGRQDGGLADAVRSAVSHMPVPVVDPHAG